MNREKIRNLELFEEVTDGFCYILKNELLKNQLSFKKSENIENDGAKCARFILENKLESVIVQHDLTDEEVVHFANGFKLRLWIFDKYKKTKEESDLKVYIKCQNKEYVKSELQKLWKVSDALLWTREIINTPANECYAETVVKKFLSEKPNDVEITILGEKEIKELGMNLLLNVNAGSKHEPKVIVVKKGNPKLAIVGKGVTFDSGGISIKPSSNMDKMIADMTGGAVTLGIAKALEGENVDFMLIAGFVENMVDANAQRPGDIWKSMNGKTVQVLNTDAEGRLILGDLVYYAGTLGIENIITIATLTGAVSVALGQARAAVLGKSFAKELFNSGEKTNEKVWELPDDKEYNRLLECKVADLQNITNLSGAGVIVGFKFIEELLKEGTKLSHLDIAGVMDRKMDNCSAPFNGFGLRILVDFIRNFK
jgi:leucyl aminopeptidase